MDSWTLVRRSLRFYWRTHLGVVAGAAVASAVLVGALVVGDSIRHSLRRFALLRLGGVELALAPRDRFFRSQLADELMSGALGLAAPVLDLRGVAASADGGARANQVHVLGVDARFWRLGGAGDLLGGLDARKAWATTTLVKSPAFSPSMALSSKTRPAASKSPVSM